MPAKKPAPKPKTKTAAPSVRKVKQPEYRSFRMGPRIRSTAKKVPSVFAIMKESYGLLMSRKRLFLGIVTVYLILTVLLVKGFSASFDLTEMKNLIQEVFSGNWGQLLTGFTLFGVLVSSSGSPSSDVAGAYQSILLVVTSLVFIWALRQTHAGAKVGIKESFYKSMYPLIPFLLVMLIIALQFLPVALATFLYSALFVTGLAVTIIEKALFLLLIFLLLLWSIYMVSASIFALYIVTLPDVTPWQALRSSREIVQHRRWVVIRKVCFLPLALFLIGAVIMIPIIIFITPLAEWFFFVLSMAVLAVAHSYLYTLYRKLL